MGWAPVRWKVGRIYLNTEIYRYYFTAGHVMKQRNVALVMKQRNFALVTPLYKFCIQKNNNCIAFYYILAEERSRWVEERPRAVQRVKFVTWVGELFRRVGEPNFYC